MCTLATHLPYDNSEEIERDINENVSVSVHLNRVITTVQEPLRAQNETNAILILVSVFRA